jgi:high-affinity Fe2+/Pb2+ permease
MLMLVVWIALVVAGLVLAVLLARLVVRDSVHAHPRRTGRIIAAILLGVILGVAMHYDYAHKRAGGRQAFLESQELRFDSFIAKPHAIAGEMTIGVLFVLAVAGTYEMAAWGLYLAIRGAGKRGAA